MSHTITISGSVYSALNCDHDADNECAFQAHLNELSNTDTFAVLLDGDYIVTSDESGHHWDLVNNDGT
jgi:hypothetical protein